jgi:hypothetical protein
MSKAKKKSKRSRRTSRSQGIPPGAKSAKEVFKRFQYMPRPRAGSGDSPDSEQRGLVSSSIVEALTSKSGQNNEETRTDRSELSLSSGVVINEPSKNDRDIPSANHRVTSSGISTKSGSEGRSGMGERMPPVTTSFREPDPLELAYRRKMQIKREAELKERRRDRNLFLSLFFIALILVVNLETGTIGLAWGFVKEKFSDEQRDERTTTKMTERKQPSTSAQTAAQRRAGSPKRRRAADRNHRRTRR